MEEIKKYIIKFDGFADQLIVLDYCDGKDLHIKRNGEAYMVRSGISGFFEVPERLLEFDSEPIAQIVGFFEAMCKSLSLE